MEESVPAAHQYPMYPSSAIHLQMQCWHKESIYNNSWILLEIMNWLYIWISDRNSFLKVLSFLLNLIYIWCKIPSDEQF